MSRVVQKTLVWLAAAGATLLATSAPLLGQQEVAKPAVPVQEATQEAVQEKVEPQQVQGEVVRRVVQVQEGGAVVEIEIGQAQAEEGAIVVEGEAIPAQVLGFAMGFDPSKMQAAKRFHLTQVFQVEIERIERICQPTPQQVAKLRIAAKGAVKKLTAEWWKKVGRRVGGVVQMEGGDNANAEDAAENDAAGTEAAEETVEVEIKDASEIDEGMSQMIIMEMDNPFRTKLPEEHPIWTKLVEGILSSEQLQSLAKHKADVEAQRRDNILNTLMGSTTFELGLTTEQQVQLREVFRPKLVDAKIQCLPFYEPFMGMYYASQVTDEELAKVLSPAQLQKLRIFFLPVKEIGAMMVQEEMMLQAAPNDE